MTWVAAGTASVSIVMGLVKNGKAKKAKKAAEREKARKAAQLSRFESNRQAVINPYAGVTDLSALAQDLSGELSNPFANLGVATSAADIEIEEADIALANTLDTLQATGASAGGATALANAAAKSKKGVAASIEKQEAANEMASAQGEQNLQQAKMQEKQRIQGIQISEGGRVQDAQARGAEFQWSAQEGRDMVQLDRMQAGIDQENQNAAQASADQQAAIGSMISAVGSVGSAAVSSGIGGKKPKKKTKTKTK